MNDRTLVTYATKHGATAGIAEKIAEVLDRSGISTELLPADQVRDLATCGAIVLGSAVYFGRWRKEAVKLLTANEVLLASKPVWLFSSGPTGTGDPSELMKGWRIPGSLQPIVRRIAPRDFTVFHGAIAAGKLSLFERWIVKMVNAPKGDYRDWDTIAAWARGIAAALRESEDAAGSQ